MSAALPQDKPQWIAKTEPANSPADLIALAIQQGADVDKLEKLMTLQERSNAQRARSEYYQAVADFQAECPILQKTKTVDFESKKTGGRTNYKYAPLSEIVETIREPLRKSGLSYRWEIEDGERITVTCIVTHVAGHAERTSMSALPDDSGAKNLIQQRGSVVSYLERYTLLGALGITSADSDDDGRSAGEMNVEALLRHNGYVREFIFTVIAIKSALMDNPPNWSAAAEAWTELETDTKRGLWLAPSRGGIFTTKEREQLKSPEFSAACKDFGNADSL